MLYDTLWANNYSDPKFIKYVKIALKIERSSKCFSAKTGIYSKEYLSCICSTYQVDMIIENFEETGRNVLSPALHTDAAFYKKTTFWGQGIPKWVFPLKYKFFANHLLFLYCLVYVRKYKNLSSNSSDPLAFISEINCRAPGRERGCYQSRISGLPRAINISRVHSSWERSSRADTITTVARRARFMAGVKDLPFPVPPDHIMGTISLYWQSLW